MSKKAAEHHKQSASVSRLESNGQMILVYVDARDTPQDALQRAPQAMPKPQPPKDTGQRPDSDALSLRPIVEHGKCRA